MEKNETFIQNPLGTEPLRKLIPHYAIPATIALVVNALYNIVDKFYMKGTNKFHSYYEGVKTSCIIVLYLAWLFCWMKQ